VGLNVEFTVIDGNELKSIVVFEKEVSAIAAKDCPTPPKQTSVANRKVLIVLFSQDVIRANSETAIA
jgi:hypothetical protein